MLILINFVRNEERIDMEFHFNYYAIGWDYNSRGRDRRPREEGGANRGKEHDAVDG